MFHIFKKNGVTANLDEVIGTEFLNIGRLVSQESDEEGSNSSENDKFDLDDHPAYTRMSINTHESEESQLNKVIED